MSRPEGHTRLEGSRRPQGVPDDVDPSTLRRADRALRQWLRGETDGVDFRTTPSGKRIVQPYDRSE